MAAAVPDRSLVRVAVVFVIVYAVLTAITWAATLSGALAPLMAATAKVTHVCLQALGVPVTLDGHDIVLASRVLRIDFDCTALPIVWMYVALVVAYPLSLASKLPALLLGVPTVFASNLLRLVVVGLLSDRLEDRTFFFVHDYLFKVFMVAVVIGLWGAYLAIARRRARER